ncbi:oligosaccharide flippase family protein [Pseudoduganella violaceinigra]|uniref:oligosaccharide flippase family protein n=1 Tax=Pseudoduganella violaceinigra TaxID=246602 RepID=UPI0004200561|nr:oligosaccharide flippase family protein [Pseudoduganella violaceinigra]
MTEPYSGPQTRRNIVAFLVGKIPTALLTASVLGLSARVLPAAEFGHYVVGMALVELVLGLSSFGLDWVLLRFLPEYRLRGSRGALAALVTRIAAVRVLSLALLACVLLLARSRGLLPASFPPELAGVLAGLLVVEGGLRILRDNTLEALALQSRMQAVTLLRGAVMAGALLAMGSGTARQLLLAELAASLGALLLAAGAIAHAVRRLPLHSRPGWQPPGLAQMRAVALHNYASGIVEYLYSPSSLILLLARSQAPEAMAGLGFVLRLTDIIRNYMPGMVIFSVVRSRMIGAYAGNSDYGELQRWAHFVFKVSALSLLPVLAVAAVYGDLVLQLASGGRFGEYRLLFAVLCGWLALRLHRLILNVVCNAIGLMGMWALASLCSLLVLPLLAWLGAPLLGLWLLPAALLGNELIVNGLVVAGMRRRGFPWPLGLRWWARALLAIGAAACVAALLQGQGVRAAAAGSLLLCAVFAAALLLSGAIDAKDRQLINRVLGRRAA